MKDGTCWGAGWPAIRREGVEGSSRRNVVGLFGLGVYAKIPAWAAVWCGGWAVGTAGLIVAPPAIEAPA